VTPVLAVPASAQRAPAPYEIGNESTVWHEKAAHMPEEELRHGPFPAGFTRDTKSFKSLHFLRRLYV